MGECDQATTESILDFYYEQVSLVLLDRCGVLRSKLTELPGRCVQIHDQPRLLRWHKLTSLRQFH